ncbi:SGNH/GDSL hydrolase family protein [Candidatus Uabimicrobium sp. HlEnr_7]|uniref:SGNH/GDSL hydrolase family protein n=1 Tax=Candidatus Uabimicrobium helgolandensis TaxID=3095367 RepID=UPI003556308D
MNSQKKKAILKHFMLFCITLSVTFVVLEFVFRKYTQTKMIPYIEMRKYSEMLLQKAQNYSHEHIPNKKASLMGVEIATNNLGFRGKNFTLEKGIEKRVFLLGSSITMGWGVKNENTCASQLQNLLNKDKESYLVVNGGVANYNTVRESLFLKAKIKQIKPDIVVLHYFVNDAEKLKDTANSALSRNSYLFAYIAMRIEEALVFNKQKFKTLEDYYTSLYSDDSTGWKAAQQAIQQIKQTTDLNNAKLIVALQPDLRDLSLDNKKYLQKIISFLKKENIAFVNLFPAYHKNFSENAKSIWISKDDAHPNKEGHRVIAEELFSAIR